MLFTLFSQYSSLINFVLQQQLTPLAFQIVSLTTLSCFGTCLPNKLIDVSLKRLTGVIGSTNPIL
jgi:hypothetical protein